MSNTETRSFLDILEKAQNGNPKARMAIINSQMKTIESLCVPVHAGLDSTQKNDLRVECIGAVDKAMELHDLLTGVDFSDVCKVTIKQAIRNYLMLRNN